VAQDVIKRGIAIGLQFGYREIAVIFNKSKIKQPHLLLVPS